MPNISSNFFSSLFLFMNFSYENLQFTYMLTKTSNRNITKEPKSDKQTQNKRFNSWIVSPLPLAISYFYIKCSIYRRHTNNSYQPSFVLLCIFPQRSIYTVPACVARVRAFVWVLASAWIFNVAQGHFKTHMYNMRFVDWIRMFWRERERAKKRCQTKNAVAM